MKVKAYRKERLPPSNLRCKAKLKSPRDVRGQRCKAERHRGEHCHWHCGHYNFSGTKKNKIRCLAMTSKGRQCNKKRISQLDYCDTHYKSLTYKAVRKFPNPKAEVMEYVVENYEEIIENIETHSHKFKSCRVCRQKFCRNKEYLESIGLNLTTNGKYVQLAPEEIGKILENDINFNESKFEKDIKQDEYDHSLNFIEWIDKVNSQQIRMLLTYLYEHGNKEEIEKARDFLNNISKWV